jgi:hypothetical protein
MRAYFDELRHYMSVSLSPFIGSDIWSIVWRPDVQCNLVSPWYASTLKIFMPFLNPDASNIHILLKDFALRRPQIAPWWLGIFLLDDNPIFAYLRRLKALSTH